MKALVADPIAEEGITILRNAGLDVDVPGRLSHEDLKARIADADALVVRSETQVTADLLAAAGRLKAVGRAGVGVDNIDIPAATQRGVVVVNSPEGNTVAACELTWALILSLARKIPDAVHSMRSGVWDRPKFVGVELRKKTLGIVGFGKIGREVAIRARAFGMEIVAYDPYLTLEQAERFGVELVELDPLLSRSDFVTLHLPLTDATRRLICAERLARMKPTAYLVNAARGGLVCEDDLVEALEAGLLAGAAVDVFVEEPLPGESPLRNSPRLIPTPHLGASTLEAQIGVAVDVAEQIIEILNGRPARNAVNMPFLPKEVLASLQPFITLAEKMGRFLAQRDEGRPGKVTLVYAGELAQGQVDPITRALLKGFLEPMLGSMVSYVNAPILAEERGISVVESKTPKSEDYTSLVRAEVRTERGTFSAAGTLLGKREVRIVEVDGYRVDIEPEGYVLLSRHHDTPGIIGRVGTLMGEAGINIAGMHLGRASRGDVAIMILNVDDFVPKEIADKVAALPGVHNARLIHF